MLGFFTDPFPDEILYSAIARYHRRTRNSCVAATARDLFGCEIRQMTVDLPSRLGFLVDRLPPGHCYTVDRLIDEHTLLPFYAPFLPPKRLQQLRSDMAGAPDGGSIHGRSGILTSHISLEYLRFCPPCVDEDRARHGEPYWHRLHQVPGVAVCPVHMVFLEDSDARTLGRGKKEVLITAKQAVRSTPARPLDPSNRDHQTHLRIARDASWLLRQAGVAADPAAIHKRYLVLLFNASAGRRSLA
jgi:TniQ